jgi:membrane protein required for beta-lactamase induction
MRLPANLALAAWSKSFTSIKEKVLNVSKVRTIVSWVLVVLLALAYLAAAAGKLTGAANRMFAHWGYAAWFCHADRSP